MNRNSLLKDEKKLEVFLWFFFAGFFSKDFWFHIMIGSNKRDLLFRVKDALDIFSAEILVGISILLTPILFWLINGQLPIEAFRFRNKNKSNIVHCNVSDGDSYIYTEQQTSQSETVSKTALSVLELFANESAMLSGNLYRRSGTYLLIGTLIAIVGVLWFSLQGISIDGNSPASLDISRVILILAPRIGVLIFIELISFFFLRQYRSAMDEHRYFESIKRDRQRAYIVTMLLHQEGTKIEIEKYIEACGFNREYGKLKTGETTEIIESKKLDAEEMKLVQNILAMIRKPDNK